MKQDTTRSAGTTPDSSGHILVCRLSLERCEQDVAHLRALLHLGQVAAAGPAKAGQGPCVFMAGIQKILSNLSQELRHSIESLSLSD